MLMPRKTPGQRMKEQRIQRWLEEGGDPQILEWDLPGWVMSWVMKSRILTVEQVIAVVKEGATRRRFYSCGPKTHAVFFDVLCARGYISAEEVKTDKTTAEFRQEPVWFRALDWWGHRCAVCDIPFDETISYRSAHADHWVPQDSPLCPGTIATNIIPLCAECNGRKSANPPYLWLVSKLGHAQANRKMLEIMRYFEWVGAHDDGS